MLSRRWRSARISSSSVAPCYTQPSLPVKRGCSEPSRCSKTRSIATWRCWASEASARFHQTWSGEYCPSPTVVREEEPRLEMASSQPLRLRTSASEFAVGLGGSDDDVLGASVLPMRVAEAFIVRRSHHIDERRYGWVVNQRHIMPFISCLRTKSHGLRLPGP